MLLSHVSMNIAILTQDGEHKDLRLDELPGDDDEDQEKEVEAHHALQPLLTPVNLINHRHRHMWTRMPGVLAI